MKCVGVVASADGAKAKVVIGHKEGCTGCGKCGRFRNEQLPRKMTLTPLPAKE